jgi:hypothetical protein
MSTPSPAPASITASRRGPSRVKLLFWLVIVPLALAALYFYIALNWNYSSGERAGWVQKFSKKGWLCKTWEGEMAMVTMPGSSTEKFLFTVRDDRVAEQINRVMGKRVTLHYEEKVGLPTTCFGETRHWVTGVAAVDEIPLAPGIVVPLPHQQPGGATLPSTTTAPTPGAPASAAPAASPSAAPVAPMPPAAAPAPAGMPAQSSPAPSAAPGK